MKIEKKQLKKSQIELNVEMSFKEFEKYIPQSVEKISKEIKIEGFRPGKAPYNIVKQKIGEMTILEEASRIAINKTLDKIIKDNVKEEIISQPKIDITKIAPNNPMTFKIILSLFPKIELGPYKNFKIKKTKIKITNEEIKKTLNDVIEMNASEIVVDRKIKNKDKVLVDIQMFLDKAPIEHGQSKDVAIIVGKDYIIPGFDKKILGMKKKEIKKFSLPYPKEHHMKNLAGKMVDFKITIKEIYERKIPELNEQFIAKFGAKNIEELKNNIKKSIIKQKEKEIAVEIEKKVLDKIIENSKFDNIPEVLVEQESRIMMSELENEIAKQGAKFEDYLKNLNKTKNQLTLDMLPTAIKRVKISLAIKKISEIEKIKVEEKELDDQINYLKEMYKTDKNAIKNITDIKYRQYLYNALMNQKTVNKLKEWNVV